MSTYSPAVSLPLVWLELGPIPHPQQMRDLMFGSLSLNLAASPLHPPSSDVVVILVSVEVPSSGSMTAPSLDTDDGKFTCTGTSETKIVTAHAA